LRPDFGHTYFNRAVNLLNWGRDDARAGQHEQARTHLRAARLHAVTAAGLGHPTAPALVESIESLLRTLGES
jgi:hypothetical protein